MSRNIPLATLREEFTVGDLMDGAHDPAPTRAPGNERLSSKFLPPEEPVDEAPLRETVQQMVDRGVSRALIMTQGTLGL